MTKLSRSECTAILSNADRSEVEAAAKLISDKYDVKIVKSPQKTLTMIKMREPVGGSIFYHGRCAARNRHDYNVFGGNAYAPDDRTEDCEREYRSLPAVYADVNVCRI